jgi:hypothetical protein
MAKRRTKTRTVYRSSPRRAAAPIVIRTSSAPVKHKKRRRSSGGSVGGDSLTSKENMALATGALALGFIDRQGMKIPTVPILGRAGTIAVGGILLGKQLHLPIATKIGKAALVIALYELGKEGKVSGVDGLDTM